MNDDPPLFHRVISYLLDMFNPQPAGVRFRLEQKRQARTTLELYALSDALNHIEGRELLGPDVRSLVDLCEALYESAINNFIAMYGEEYVIILSEADRLKIDYQEERQRIVLQPADPLAVITLRR